LLCSLACFVLAQAEPLSQGDRDFTLSALHATRKQVVDTISGLSPAQLRWKPAPDRWSVFEVLEHLALSETSIPQMAAQALKSPATPEKRIQNAREVDAKLLAQYANRDKKGTAPASLTPASQFKTASAALKAFVEARDRNLAYIRTTQDDLRAHFTERPPLDALQVYLLLAGHTERHVAQMREVMASPGFPKK